MERKDIVIWGAGKIGRGFLGDLFHRGNYSITFVDADANLVKNLKDQGSYTLHNLRSAEDSEKIIIDKFDVLHCNDKDKIQKVLSLTQLIAVAVYPQAFEETAGIIAQHIEVRQAQQEVSPLDIILCANIHNPSFQFRQFLESHLSEEGKQYLSNHVGIAESLVIRMAVEPTKEMRNEDPLVVVTNGYKQLTVDKLAFKNDLPEIEGIRPTERIAAEEMRKMYSYNMIHAVYAYLGKLKGFTTIMESIEDEDIQCIAQGALEEVSKALQKEFDFTESEMNEWNLEVLENMANPILKDTIDRVGGNPIRKLQKNDRLIGPALLCRKNGIMPYYLCIAIAAGFMFTNPEDSSAVEIQDFLKVYDIKTAIKRYTKLSQEMDIIQQIAERYMWLKTVGFNGINQQQDRIRIVKQAYEFGFNNELTIRGCAQCAIKAMGEVTGKVEKELFQAASGLSGGIAIVGDGSCGGYTGGVLYMGTYIGRRLDHLSDGDKIAQYKAYEMAQNLHDRFIETYGSVTCADIHTGIFGKSYSLRTKAVRNDFEEAGGHRDKCTTVIAMASAWIADILIDNGFIPSA